MAETAHAGLGNGPRADDSGGTQDQVKQKAGEAKEQVKEQAQQAAGQARGRVRDEADRRSTQAGERVQAQASDLRSVGDQLRQQGKEGPAKIADQLADRAERVGGYLQRSDGDTLLEDLEEIARKNPWAVVAGGVVVGFAASRLLKTSSRDRYDQRTGGQGGLGQRSLPARTSYGSPYGAETAAGTDAFGSGGAPMTPAAPATTPLPDSAAMPPGTPLAEPGLGADDPLHPRRGV
jgi:ElaB/YqjD/DUF883 family membrane-anchored ribosome-binding protein